MSELDPNGVEAAATAIVGAEVGYEMKLSRLVDGVSTYTLKLETGEQFEFGNTDDVYEKIASEKAKRQAEAAITAYLSTVSPLSDGDGWQLVTDTAPKACHVVLTQHVDDLFPVAAFRLTGGEWLREIEGPEDVPATGKNWPLHRAPTHWRELLPAPPRDEVAHE